MIFGSLRRGWDYVSSLGCTFHCLFTSPFVSNFKVFYLLATKSHMVINIKRWGFWCEISRPCTLLHDIHHFTAPSSNRNHIWHGEHTVDYVHVLDIAHPLEIECTVWLGNIHKATVEFRLVQAAFSTVESARATAGRYISWNMSIVSDTSAKFVKHSRESFLYNNDKSTEYS